ESGTCAADDKECRARATASEVAPERPQFLQVVRATSRSLAIEWRAHPEGPLPDSYLLRLDPGAQEDTLEHDTYDALSGVQTHTINGLRPDTEYLISLRALGSGGESSKATLTYRTQMEEVSESASPYDIMEEMHCGMSSSEEVQPSGPAPDGNSFFTAVTDAEGCRVRCDDNPQCVAFQ
ncbi:unnamed protein product, partial [Polarella glacialis]